jgi:hypothetical protein
MNNTKQTELIYIKPKRRRQLLPAVFYCIFIYFGSGVRLYPYTVYLRYFALFSAFYIAVVCLLYLMAIAHFAPFPLILRLFTYFTIFTTKCHRRPVFRPDPLGFAICVFWAKSAYMQFLVKSGESEPKNIHFYAQSGESSLTFALFYGVCGQKISQNAKDTHRSECLSVC